MTQDEFWIIVDRVRAGAATTDERLARLQRELSTLSLADLQSFDANWRARLAHAYTYKLWGAAYLIGGGCSDGAFWDFRSTLIMQGRTFFEAAIADPDSLADADYSEDTTDDYPFTDVYNYAAEQMLKARGEEEASGPNPHPDETLGAPWVREDLPRLYPKLAAKFDWNS